MHPESPSREREYPAMADLGPAAGEWLARADAFALTLSGEATRLDVEAKAAGELIRAGFALLEKLPPRSQRRAGEKAAAEAVVRVATGLCRRVARTLREPIYARLTDAFRRHPRVDELVYRAAELWPGLVPTRTEIAREMRRMQADKDGLEILQGCLLSELLASPAIGLHMVNSGLRPTAEAEARLEAFRRTGALELAYARVEARGETGYVYARNPEYLNAEDYETLGAQETAVDLVLLHPELKMGVLRGDFVEHPRYRGRRIFNAGLNLTKVYHGKLPYLFYVERELGLVNKFYRGLAAAEFDPELPEETREKPWCAAVEGFAIGGGCQLLLVMDYVLAERGAFFNLPARKEGIIPGAANLRLPRLVGERQARAGILFDRRFEADGPEAPMMVNEVVAREAMDEAIARVAADAVDSGVISAAGNRKAIRVQAEPLDVFRRYMALYAYEQALCQLSEQLIANLERHWNARERRLAD